MYDFVKIGFSSIPYANFLKQSEYLTFVKESRREYSSANTYTCRGLVFDIYDSGRITISGSLHKYWNEGQHNYNDFSYTELLNCIQDLTQRFTAYFLTGEVNNIEAGVNVILPFQSSEYISKIIGVLGTERHPITKNDLKGFQKGFHFQKSQYGIKIYNKGKQYNRLDQIIRHEIKTYKMQPLDSIRIKKVYDLCDLKKLQQVAKLLISKYEDVLINEFVDLNNLSKPQERIYLECINPDSWSSWGRDKRYKRKGQFEEIIKEFGQSDIKRVTENLICAKVGELLVNTAKSTDVFTNIQTRFNLISGLKSTDVFTVNIMSRNVDLTAIKRTCMSCGKDISHQSQNSKFCSAKYVGYEEAHKCRNSASNPKNNFFRKIDKIKANGVLFEIDEYIKPQYIRTQN